MNCEQVRERLLIDRAAAELDDATEKGVLEHLSECTGCRTEAAELEATWSLMGRVGDERSTEAMRERFHEMLSAVQQEERRPEPTARGVFERLGGLWPRQVGWQVAIAAIMLVVGLWLGPRITPGASSEFRELRAEMQSMSRAVTLSLLEHPSASERLRAVSLGHRAQTDPAVTRALLDVIREDRSVNVRLAALDVLASLAEQPDVRSGLLDAFTGQVSPTMQVAMADVLLAMDGPRPRAAIRSLLENDTVNEGVRSHIRRTLTRKENEL